MDPICSSSYQEDKKIATEKSTYLLEAAKTLAALAKTSVDKGRLIDEAVYQNKMSRLEALAETHLTFIYLYICSYPDDAVCTKLDDITIQYSEALQKAYRHLKKIIAHNLSIKPQSELPQKFAHEVSSGDPIVLGDFLRFYASFLKTEEIHRGLRQAAAEGHFLHIPILLEYGAHVEVPGPQSGRIALHFAVLAGQTDSVIELLKMPNSHKVVDPDQQLLFKDNFNKTPMDYVLSLESTEKKLEILEAMFSSLDDIPPRAHRILILDQLIQLWKTTDPSMEIRQSAP